MKIKLLVLPKDSNPYQESLYGAMGNNITVRYLGELTLSRTLNFILLPFELIFFRLLGYKIIHLHWLFAFSISRTGTISRKFSEQYFFLFLSLMNILGYRLVWTVHNVLPHETTFPNDIELTRFLANACSKIIVHSKSTVEEMKRLRIGTSKTTIIPIASKTNLASNLIPSQHEARQSLKIADDSFVFLFFGLIREYKGVSELLSVFTKVKNVHPNAILLIAGENKDDHFPSELMKYASNSIITDLKYQSESTLSNYISASNVTVLPYKKVTTSSTALHSLSYGKPIVAPKIGPFTEYPETVGYFYDPAKNSSLETAMLSAIQEDALSEKSNNAVKYSATFSMSTIAKKTETLFQSLL